MIENSLFSFLSFGMRPGSGVRRGRNSASFSRRSPKPLWTSHFNEVERLGFAFRKTYLHSWLATSSPRKGTVEAFGIGSGQGRRKIAKGKIKRRVCPIDQPYQISGFYRGHGCLAFFVTQLLSQLRFFVRVLFFKVFEPEKDLCP